MTEQLQRTSAQLADSIAQLVMELNELKDRKKAFNSDINERIKDLEEQIAGENEQWMVMKAKEGN
jgi:FtsZ-binding cell division protein ZapB